MHAPPAGVVPLRLSVLEPDGTRITLELYSDNTVGEVKAHLARGVTFFHVLQRDLIRLPGFSLLHIILHSTWVEG